MRIRLIFNPPLTPYKCWYEITEDLTIKDLASRILKDFHQTQNAHPKGLKLELDGFELYKRGTTGGLLKENDIVNVQLQKGAKLLVESENKVSERSKLKRRRVHSPPPLSSESTDLPPPSKKFKLARTTAPSPPSSESSASPVSHPALKKKDKVKKDKVKKDEVKKDEVIKATKKKDDSKVKLVEESNKGLKKVIKEAKSKLARKSGSEKVTEKEAVPLNKNATSAKKVQPTAAKVAQASEPKNKSAVNESDSDSSSDDDSDTSNSANSDSDSDKESHTSNSADSGASSSADNNSSSDSDTGDKNKRNASETAETVHASAQAANGEPQGQTIATLVLAEKKPATVLFGEGKLSTKLRNQRKRQKKYQMRLAAGIPNGTAEATPAQGGQQQIAAVTTREIPTCAAPDTGAGAPTTTIKSISILSPPPPLLLTNRNKKKGFLKDMVGRERLHIRFDGEGEGMEGMEQGEQEEQEEQGKQREQGEQEEQGKQREQREQGEQGKQEEQGEQGEQGEETQDWDLTPWAPALAPARAIITSVELECSTANGRQGRGGSKRGRPTQQERQYPVQRGPRVVVAEGYCPKGAWDGSVGHDGGDSADFNAMIAEYEGKRTPRNKGMKGEAGGWRGGPKRAKMQEVQATKDYDKMESFVGVPMPGDVIAYKVLEMSSSYTPEISDFKEATLQSFDPSTNAAILRLLHANTPVIGAELEFDPDTGLPRRRRFELDDDTLREEFLIADVAGTESVGDVVVVKWTELMDVRRVSPAAEVDGETAMA